MNMKKQSAGVSFLTAFLGVILSIIFVVSAFVLPVYYSVAGLLQPQTVTAIIQNIDYVEIIESSPEVKEAIISAGLDSAAADEIIKSKEAKKLIEDFAGTATDILFDANEAVKNFDSEYLQGLVDEHFDGILTAAEKATGKEIPKEELKNSISTYIEENSEEIDNAVPVIRPISETAPELAFVSGSVYTTLGTGFIIGAIAVLVLILGLIYLLRKYNFGGFVWIAVNCGITGLLVGGVFALVSSSLIDDVINSIPSFPVTVVEAALSAASGKLLTALIVLGALMVASIAACISLRIYFKKKQAAIPLDNFAEMPAETTADEPKTEE